MTHPDPTVVRWYPVINDLVGGWCILTAPVAPSTIREHDNTAMIGDFLTENTARHIADLHNDWLSKGGPE